MTTTDPPQESVHVLIVEDSLVQSQALRISLESQPTPAAAPDDPPLIWADALEGVGGKEETLRELAGLMLEECPRLLEQMRRSLADGDVEELRRAAHTLKGSARLFAAHPTADADDVVARVQTEVDRLLIYIRNEILA